MKKKCKYGDWFWRKKDKFWFAITFISIFKFEIDKKLRQFPLLGLGQYVKIVGNRVGVVRYCGQVIRPKQLTKKNDDNFMNGMTFFFVKQKIQVRKC